MGLVEATTEHVVPRIKGGPSRLENEVAACRRCNGQRGHLTPGEWYQECERRGWQPDRGVLVRVLTALEEAIERDGGHRRARAYVSTQLRRLEGAERPVHPDPPPTDAHGRVIRKERARR